MPMTLGPEMWGERLFRAFRVAREQYGLTYESVAQQITRIGNPVSQQTLQRLTLLDSPPSQRPIQFLVRQGQALGEG